MQWLADNVVNIAIGAFTAVTAWGVWKANARKQPTIDPIVEPLGELANWRSLRFRIVNNEAAGLTLKRIAIASGDVRKFFNRQDLGSKDDVHERTQLALDATPDPIRVGRRLAADFRLTLAPLNDPRRWEHSDGDGRTREAKAHVQLSPSAGSAAEPLVLPAVATFSWTDRATSSFRVKFTITIEPMTS